MGFPDSGAKFYRTVVRLDIEQGLDVSLGFVLGPGTGNATGAVRAQLYVNGYQFAKYVPYIGNQVVFPGKSFFCSPSHGLELEPPLSLHRTLFSSLSLISFSTLSFPKD